VEVELLWPSRDRIEVVAHSGENAPGVYYILLHHCSFGSVDLGLRNWGLALVARNENSLVFQI
jgi:hypothetical protein